MQYRVRPISDRSWFGSMGKAPTQFSSKWSSTVALLGYEIDAINGRDVVLEIDIHETDLKLNGELRAHAAPHSRAVVVAFETSEHGQLIYRCDRLYTNWAHQGPDWQHNVRAIAKYLEAQRAQARWGVSGVSGGTYGGFKALGGGAATPMPAGLSKGDAAERLRQYAPGVVSLDDAFKLARRKTHPDLNAGDHSAWLRVEEAAKALGLL